MLTISNNSSRVILEIRPDDKNPHTLTIELDGKNATLLLLELAQNIEQLVSKPNKAPAADKGFDAVAEANRRARKELRDCLAGDEGQSFFGGPASVNKKKVSFEDFMADINLGIKQATDGMKKE